MKRQTIDIAQPEITKQNEYTQKLNDYSERFRKREGRYPRYFIRTFGCQQNESDSEVLAGILVASGFEQASKYEDADLSVINTCSVRENADNHLYGHLGILKSLYQQDKHRLTAVCGCMLTQPQHVEKIRKSYSFVNLLFSPQDLYRFPELLFNALEGNAAMQVAISEDDPIAEGLPVLRKRNYRALVSIMYGCDHYCTYCIVPYTRGRERSRKPSDILRELNELGQEGFPEVMLLGQNVNAWGKDFKRRSIIDNQAPAVIDFADLLAASAQIDGLKRIRYMSPYPRDFTQKVINTIGAYENIEPHIHLPLQSGSNNVLRRMRRGYDRDKFIDIAKEARRARPGLSITTDIIVGFPGETEQDFEDTLRVMEEVKFDSAFTFIYSPRPHTPAAAYTDQVDPDIVSKRFERLLALQNQHSLEANQALVGKQHEILIEGVSSGNNQVLTGRTADFKLINFSIPDHLRNELPPEAFTTENTLAGNFFEGKFCDVKLTNAKTFSIEGEMISSLRR